jgi:dihydrofolate reductase
VPVFVLTHHEREPLTLGGTTFYFVTEGIESALAQAREAAGDEDVTIGGGGDVGRQYLAAGLVDQLQLNVAPILLGDGVRLFENGAGAGLDLDPTLVVHTPAVTHLRYGINRG